MRIVISATFELYLTNVALVKRDSKVYGLVFPQRLFLNQFFIAESTLPLARSMLADHMRPHQFSGVEYLLANVARCRMNLVGVLDMLLKINLLDCNTTDWTSNTRRS